MRSNDWVAAALAAVLCGSTMVAGAASDYYLKITGIEGESKESAVTQTLAVASFSWGTSNSGSASSTSRTASEAAGVRESPTKAGATAREAGSGMATGRRSRSAVASGSDASSQLASSEPATGADEELSVIVPDTGGDTTAALDRMCAKGTHIKEAVLGSGGKTYQMRDLIVVSCAVQGQAREVRYKTGHVTLIK